MADQRRLADVLGASEACPYKVCRRGGRCVGPRGAMQAAPNAPMPGCLAIAFEGLYRPVAEWDELIAAMERIVARYSGNEPEAE